MSSINKVILVGYVGKEPELRYLADNVAVASFPLATSEYIMKGGVRTEQVEWHHIVMWRALAEAAQKTLHKGRLIYIQGKLKTHAFDDWEQVKRYVTEIVADNFVLLGRASDFEPSEVKFA